MMYRGSFLTAGELADAVPVPAHGDVAFVGLLTKSYDAAAGRWDDALVAAVEDDAGDIAAVEVFSLDAGNADTGTVCVGEPGLGNSSFSTSIDQGQV